MFMFRVNDDRVINLEYLIQAERIDHETGKVRVTVESGITVDLARPEGDRLLDQLGALAADPWPRPTATVIRRGEAPPPGASGPSEGRAG